MIKEIDIFIALSNEIRLNIVKLLQKKELCACQIHPKIGSTQSNTSMQLAKLLQLGIIKQRKEGRMILYSIKENKINEILKVMKK